MGSIVQTFNMQDVAKPLLKTGWEMELAGRIENARETDGCDWI